MTPTEKIDIHFGNYFQDEKIENFSSIAGGFQQKTDYFCNNEIRICLCNQNHFLRRNKNSIEIFSIFRLIKNDDFDISNSGKGPF